jgi:hypothetical protein
MRLLGLEKLELNSAFELAKPIAVSIFKAKWPRTSTYFKRRQHFLSWSCSSSCHSKKHVFIKAETLCTSNCRRRRTNRDCMHLDGPCQSNVPCSQAQAHPVMRQNNNRGLIDRPGRNLYPGRRRRWFYASFGPRCNVVDQNEYVQGALPDWLT